jgi:AcrR family transcriptional regulator
MIFSYLLLSSTMSNDKREHIMEVAVELFATNGFEGTSIRQLAQRADVNIAMIHYYFGSKEKLFETMLEHKASYMRNRIEAVEANQSLTEIEKLDQIIEDYVARFLSQPEFHRVLQQELLVSQREALHQNVISLFAKNTQNVVAIIEKGIRKKQFRKVDPPLVFSSIIGTINQVMQSRTLCNMLMNKAADNNPYQDLQFKKRLIQHLKQMIHAQLLIEKDI